MPRQARSPSRCRVGAAVRSSAPTPLAEERVTEEGAEDVRQVAEIEVAGREAAAAQPVVPEAVVGGTALGIGQHLVGLGGLAEALLCIRSPGDVRVQLARELAKSLLDLSVARAPVDAEDLVIVALSRCHGLRE